MMAYSGTLTLRRTCTQTGDVMIRDDFREVASGDDSGEQVYTLRIDRIIMLTLLVLMTLCSTHASADLASALQNMENSSNPLVRISTDRGDVYAELFPRAAPRNVEHFLALAEEHITSDETELEIELDTQAEPESRAGIPSYGAYYDGLPFHRVVANHFVQASSPLTPHDPIPHEINAQRLGLHEQRVVNEQGALHPWLEVNDAEDFRSKVLLPLYHSMGIRNEDLLTQRQNEVMQRLQQLNLQQLYEMQGYRYDGSFSSRMPLAGSLMMVPYGPEGNGAGFFITLLDAPWLMGKNTVIGQVVSGLETVRLINQAGAGNTRIIRIRQVSDQTSLTP